MSSAQKIIKYIAISFAFFLIFSIISGITIGIRTVVTIFDDDDSVMEELNLLDINEDANILEVDISASKLVIKPGDSFKAETNNSYINCNQDGNRLTITEKKHSWLHKNNQSELLIYIPEDFVFDAVTIKTGAGKVDIEELTTKKLYLDLGAGKIDIHYLNVLDQTFIDGGAGAITIQDGTLSNLDLDMGVGKLVLTATLIGNSEIDSGVGSIDLNLIGDSSIYKIKLDKGIGSATINGNNMKDDTYYGDGSNTIDIDGDVGSIQIRYVD